jgi:hypothetical protein
MEEKKELTKGQGSLETKLSEMTPLQREQLERLKQQMIDKRDKEMFKANLRQQQLRKKVVKRAKKAKVEKKSRKINRKKK